MCLMNKDHVISFEKELNEISSGISQTQERVKRIDDSFEETDVLLRELQNDIAQLLGTTAVCEAESDLNAENAISELNMVIDNAFEGDNSQAKLSGVDTVVGIVAGIIASVIDIAFVGAPEVVKIYRGGENFDGSILTAALRKIGNGDNQLSEMLDWLCQKCKVPYDISIVKDTATPNNHRLRNFAHDPLLGALFATADILMGTATFIDNSGSLRVVINDRSYPDSEKLFSLAYYLGHLLSDVCTARGLPIPGFFMTQFFASDSEKSIAKICEQMYKDGYDLRHFASMSTPVAVKNLIVELYIRVFKAKELTGLTTITQREIFANQKKALKYRILLVSDAVACTGNVIKFFLPPNGGNPTAINLPEWASLISNTIASVKYELRNKDVERAIEGRNRISQTWAVLLLDE